VSENRVLRKIFGFKRDEIIRGWTEKYTMRNVIRVIFISHQILLECTNHSRRDRQGINTHASEVHRKLDKKFLRNRSIGRIRLRGKHNIKIDLEEIGYDYSELD
jgi:hypothetical protein